MVLKKNRNISNIIQAELIRIKQVMQKMGRYRSPAMKIDSVSNRLAAGFRDL